MSVRFGPGVDAERRRRVRALVGRGAPATAIAIGGTAVGALFGDANLGWLVPFLVLGTGWLVGTMAVGAMRDHPGDVAVLRTASNAAFRRELDRARRHRRAFALVRLSVGDVPLEAGSGPLGDGIAATTLRLLGTSLRITDSAWVQGDAVMVLLPESDRATAAAFLQRARQVAPGRFAQRAGIALFPDDGLTSGALFEAAERDMLGHLIPQSIAPTLVAASVGDIQLGAEIELAESGVG